MGWNKFNRWGLILLQIMYLSHNLYIFQCSGNKYGSCCSAKFVDLFLVFEYVHQQTGQTGKQDSLESAVLELTEVIKNIHGCYAKCAMLLLMPSFLGQI